MSTAAVEPGRKRIGVLTSGGDAQGMNAAVRAVVRAGIAFGAEVYAVHEGFQGLVDGGDSIRRLGWDDVAGIQHRGGTTLGSARCLAFRERDGLRLAVRNLLACGIDRLVAIGGDGSLSGADELAELWPELIAELIESGEVPPDAAEAHPRLHLSGIVGSIDNDMVGTDMTVGADSALHRIVEAIDALASTASSHQRTFVIEVMGRRCGYLALTAAIAGGCDYAFVPEAPPAPDWESELGDVVRRARAAGRRHRIVLVAEGARDTEGTPITADQVCAALQENLGEEARVTILGHVQRGGKPSAFDRSMSTMMGYAAAQALLASGPDDAPSLIGLHRNRVRRRPLRRAVAATREVARLIDAGDYAAAQQARGESFTELHRLLDRINEHPGFEALAGTHSATNHGKRIAIVHKGGLAPGMNPAVRAAVRIGAAAGHTMLGVSGGFQGLIEGDLRILTPLDVEGWAGLGGAELGSRRGAMPNEEFYALSRALEQHEIDALLVIGGFDAFEAVHALQAARSHYPTLGLPIALLPATIDNSVPGTEVCVGSDTALGVIVESIDRIKASAMAARRCFVIETMGRRCGYLALMASLSAGAEQVYLPEEGIALGDLARDVGRMKARFGEGRRLYLVVRSEHADDDYNTDAVARVFDAEAQGLFDVRQVVLAHVQQGGDPSPFDRILATRLAAHAVDLLADPDTTQGAWVVGLQHGEVVATTLAELDAKTDWAARRPRDQWWLGLRSLVRDFAAPPR